MCFPLEISGNDFKDEHFANRPKRLLILDISHLEISGNDINEEHP